MSINLRSNHCAIKINILTQRKGADFTLFHYEIPTKKVHFFQHRIISKNSNNKFETFDEERDLPKCEPKAKFSAKRAHCRGLFPYCEFAKSSREVRWFVWYILATCHCKNLLSESVSRQTCVSDQMCILQCIGELTPDALGSTASMEKNRKKMVNKQMFFYVFAADFIKICNRNDPEVDKCIVNAIEEIRPKLVKVFII